MKKLTDILYRVRITKFRGQMDSEIRNVCFDSRKTGPDDMFVALKGTKSDGHEFIPMAIDKGARVIICETLPEKVNDNVCYIEVKDAHEALGYIASTFYDNPSEKIKLIGVTGTNGKTTIATLLYSLARSIGYKAGLLSTISVAIEDRTRDASHTTPDPLQINHALSEMVAEGCDFAFMEVSSHAAAQKRITGLSFSGGIFTNITRDHLDYHKEFNEYLKAKKSFFDNLPASAFALYNADDKNGKVMIQNTKAKVYSYGIKSVADFRAAIIESHLEGNLLKIENKEIWTRLPGAFNACNVLAVYSAALLSGMPEEFVLESLSEQTSVQGRFDIVNSQKGITGIVDYAHTPDALENVLSAINKIRNRPCKLITIIGAGGNRDRGKRPAMARIASELSDFIILTSDNPRDEDPEEIIKDMKAGIEPVVSEKVISITDREEAIKTACALAKYGDIILLAGKGHESYQEIKGVRKPFDDKEMLRKYL